MQQWVYDHGIHWSFHITCHPGAAGLSDGAAFCRCRGGVSLEMIPCEDGALSSRTQYTLKSMIITWCCVERRHGSGNLRVEVDFNAIIPGDPLGGICASSILHLLGSVGLEVLVPRENMLPPGYAARIQ